MSTIERQHEKEYTFRAMHTLDPFGPRTRGTWVGLRPRGTRVHRARDDQFGLRPHARAPRRTGHARPDGPARRGHRRGDGTPRFRHSKNGYGRLPADAAEAIQRVAMAGAVGGSIEDFDRKSHQLYEIDHAVDRTCAAAEATHGLAFPFTLTARVENHIRDNPDFATPSGGSCVRGSRADFLYGRGWNHRGQLHVVRRGLQARQRLAVPGLSVDEIVDAGAQRISVGGSLTWVAVKAFSERGQRRSGNRGDVSALSARVPLGRLVWATRPLDPSWGITSRRDRDPSVRAHPSTHARLRHRT